MRAIVVGADTLGKIPTVLHAVGIEIDRHITGRNSAHQRKLDRLPSDVDLMIIFTDFLGHNVMRHFRQLATEHNVQYIACRRSVCALKKSLVCAGFNCDNCPKKQMLLKK